jgi:DNA replication and repair protein RecF
VHLEWVEFSDFRNYRNLSLTPAPNLNILTGPNAQGKTNLLEGLAFLLIGRSFRSAKPAELPHWDSAGTVVAGQLRRMETVRPLRRTATQREDGAWAVTGEGCPWARAIPFGWQDLAILTNGPQTRRNFLDGFAGKLYPVHLTTQKRYRQILARRNHLLQGGLDLATLRERLTPWNEQLVRVGLELLNRRRSAAVSLGVEAARLYPQLAGDGKVRLEYHCALGPNPTESDFAKAVEGRLVDEVRRGQTLCGPHRDDLLIEVDGRDLRTFGSRGQQRLMTLALRLAEAGPVTEAVGSSPVLLLDDALSELDPVVQGRVLEHIARAGQVFLTTADAALPDVGTAAWWEVKGGQVTDTNPAAVRGAA